MAFNYTLCLPHICKYFIVILLTNFFSSLDLESILKIGIIAFDLEDSVVHSACNFNCDGLCIFSILISSKLNILLRFFRLL